MSTQNDDLSVDGPGSPVSLRKFIDTSKRTSKHITVLLDQTGDGIALDDPHTNYITADACKTQASWFLQTYPGKVPLYAARHILYMFSGNSYQYASSEAFAREAGVDETHPDLKLIQNKFKYGLDNPEFLQILGLIQLISGTLTASKKANQPVRIMLEHPETHLHPQRTAKLMSLLNALDKEFGSGIIDDSDE